jgi:hypothetical protein
MSGKSVYPTLISNPLDFRLNPPAFSAFLAYQLSSDNTPPGNLSFCCCTVMRSVKTSAMQTSLNRVKPALPAATRRGVVVVHLSS